MVLFVDNDEQTFAMTSEDEVWKSYDVKKDGIVLLKKFDEGRSDFEGKIGVEVNHSRRNTRTSVHYDL